MSAYKDFSSLPPEEERQFAVYEERSQVAAQKATKSGIIGGAVVGVVWILFAAITFPSWSAEQEAAEEEEGAAAAAEGEDELGAE